MKTMYHVAGEAYESGDPLLCWNRLADMGIEVEWKWGEADAGFDGDCVCLFSTHAEAVDFQSLYGGTILTVTIPDVIEDLYELATGGYISPRMMTVDEGYTAVQNGIPAEWITEG